MENPKALAFLDQLTKIKKELFIGALVLIVGGLAFAIYSYQQHQKEYAASRAYFQATQAWTNKEKPLENLKEESNRLTLEGFVNEHKNTGSAMSASLLLADHYNSENNNEKALEVLQKNDTKVFNFISALYAYRKALAYEKVSKCEESIKELSKIIGNSAATFLQADARLQKALCLEQVGKKDEAKVEYETLSSSFSDTEAGKSAKKFLRLIDLGA